MSCDVKVVKHSISPEGKEIVTYQLRYWRAIHAELMTHRVFSRNASSSRAIPVKKMLAQVWNDPAGPIHWGANQPGMQAKKELTGLRKKVAWKLWKLAGRTACGFAWSMMKLGLHKQVANRILEPWQYIHVVLTATETNNWDELRDHSDAQPEIRELAVAMKLARSASAPKRLEYGEWHLPYVTAEDLGAFGPIQDHLRGGKPGWAAWTDMMKWDLARKVSAARCCRVSYLKHDGTQATIEEDLKLCEDLAGARPIHASPFEHQATPVPQAQPQIYFNGNGDVERKGYVPKGVSHIDMKGWAWSGNLCGWIQHRKLIEAQFAPA